MLTLADAADCHCGRWHSRVTCTKVMTLLPCQPDPAAMNTRFAHMFAMLLLLVTASGCASATRAQGSAEAPQPAASESRERERNVDPFESINRFNFAVHRVGDRLVLRPIARTYRAVTPQPIRNGIGNFFRNLGMPIVIVNNVLQGKFSAAVDDTGRFLVNSTLGLAGVIDVASRAGLERHNEDFGQTLGSWGVTPGPYVFIPFIGPTTFRDGIGTAVDGLMFLLVYYPDSSVRDKAAVLLAVNERAGLLSVDGNIDSAVDPYLFVRDAYLQRRRFLVYDGNPPDDGLYDLDDLEDLEDLDELEELEELD
jgi:phospholipid-binding lipoprotein MlaA